MYKYLFLAIILIFIGRLLQFPLETQLLTVLTFLLDFLATGTHQAHDVMLWYTLQASAFIFCQLLSTELLGELMKDADVVVQHILYLDYTR